MAQLWTVELAQKASEDLDQVILHTEENFGRDQAVRYSALIGNALQELSRSGPAHPLAKERSEVLPGILSMQVQRAGKKARHILFFKELEQKIVIVRILHESMDFREHL